MRGDQAVVAGDNFHVDAQLSQLAQRLQHAWFGRIKEDEEARKGQRTFVVVGQIRRQRHWFGGNTENAITLRTPRRIPLSNLLFLVWIKGQRSLVTLDLSTDGQHIVERAFGNQPLLTVRPLHDNTQPFAHKVIGQFVNFAIKPNSETIHFGLGNNRLIQHIRQPGLKHGIKIGITLHQRGRLALHIQRAVKLHNPSG